MKKRFTGILLMVPMIMAISTVLAAEGTLLFNIEGYQKLALQNSKQAVIDELDIKAKESALKDAQRDAEFTVTLGTTKDMYNGAITREVATLQAETELEYAKRAKKDNEEKTRLDIYKASLNVLLLQKNLEMQTSLQKNLEEKLKMAEARYKEGKITDSDLDDSRNLLDIKIIEVEKAEKDLEAANLELKRLLNVEMDDTPIKVDDKLVPAKEEVVVLNEVIEKAMEKNLDLYKKTQDLKAKEKTMEISEKYYKEGDFTYDDNKTSLEIARAEEADARTKLEVDVRNQYNNLLTAKDNVELAQKWEAICRKKLDSEKLKFEKGLISREELLSTEEKYLDAQYKTFAAIKDYNSLKADFDSLYK